MDASGSLEFGHQSRYERALGVSDQVDLLGTRGLQHAIDELGDLRHGDPTDVRDSTEFTQRPCRAGNRTVGERVDAIALVVQERTVGGPVGGAAAHRAVDEHHRAGLVDARPAVPVVGAGQRSPRRAQCECGSGQEVMGDGQGLPLRRVGGAGVGRGDQRERDCGERDREGQQESRQPTGGNCGGGHRAIRPFRAGEWVGLQALRRQPDPPPAGRFAESAPSARAHAGQFSRPRPVIIGRSLA